MRTFKELEKDFYEMQNMSCRPNYKKTKTGDVIDEDKSVRWNREEVIRLQEKYEEDVKKLNTEKNKRRDELTKETYKVIQSEVKNISLDEAKFIYDYARNTWGNELFSELEDLTYLIYLIVNHKKC